MLEDFEFSNSYTEVWRARRSCPCGATATIAAPTDATEAAVEGSRCLLTCMLACLPTAVAKYEITGVTLAGVVAIDEFEN